MRIVYNGEPVQIVRELDDAGKHFACIMYSDGMTEWIEVQK